jgi:hypothetical protein
MENENFGRADFNHEFKLKNDDLDKQNSRIQTKINIYGSGPASPSYTKVY